EDAMRRSSHQNCRKAGAYTRRVVDQYPWSWHGQCSTSNSRINIIPGLGAEHITDFRIGYRSADADSNHLAVLAVRVRARRNAVGEHLQAQRRTRAGYSNLDGCIGISRAADGDGGNGSGSIGGVAGIDLDA